MTLDHQPTYDGTPIFCKQFASNVEIGTYILFKDEEGDEMKEVVGQILQVHSASKVIVAVYKPFGDIEPRIRRPITDGLGKCLREIVSTLSQTQVKITQISNLAFVFSPEKLEELGAVLQGITNAFVCRFSLNNVSFHPISFPCESEFCPVPCSLARKLYEDTERVRDVIVGILNRVSELQGDHARVLKRSSCSPEFWSYLKYRTRGRGIAFRCFSGRQIRYRLSHRMNKMKFSIPYQLELVRFESGDKRRDR